VKPFVTPSTVCSPVECASGWKVAAGAAPVKSTRQPVSACAACRTSVSV
jgi:hypothetical protein